MANSISDSSSLRWLHGRTLVKGDGDVDHQRKAWLGVSDLGNWQSANAVDDERDYFRRSGVTGSPGPQH